MTEPREVTRTECRCDRRIAALALGDFVFWPHSRVWVFTEGPLRSMSAAARIGAFVDRREFKHEDHDGEPYSWVSCPWCGHELPGTQVPRIVWPQADGADPNE
jgi:hypothetical protein